MRKKKNRGAVDKVHKEQVTKFQTQNPEGNQRRLKFMECKEFHLMSWHLIMERKLQSQNANASSRLADSISATTLESSSSWCLCSTLTSGFATSAFVSCT